ncbi:transcription factor SPT20 homolog [Uloborus diversus]|uniref:transcription factor SPT20 homolog n=1 Tax=Uloborus diversus TaxID=327109 RepID=UPI00240A166B|nr:transcription factor SPT20 homolog [Uloborus diversus]
MTLLLRLNSPTSNVYMKLSMIWLMVSLLSEGKTESLIPAEEDQAASASENSLQLGLPLYQLTSTPIQSQTVQSSDRRMSLEDFFLNGNSQQQAGQQAAQQQAPVAQFQVNQPDPNSILFSRDTQFPSSSGGIISRMLMLRRMLRLRRMVRRLTLIPRVLGLGLGPLRRAQVDPVQSAQQPLSIFNNRVGQSYPEPYNPRDYVFGDKAFSYNNTSSKQASDSSSDQQQQQTRDFPLEAEPYYDSVNDLPYNLYDDSNQKSADSFESDELRDQQLQQQNYNSIRPLVDSNRQILPQDYDNSDQSNNQLQTLQLLQLLQDYQRLQDQNQALNAQKNQNDYDLRAQNQLQNNNNQLLSQHRQNNQDQYNQQQSFLEEEKLYEQLEKLREQQQLILQEQQLRQQLQQLILAQQAHNSQDLKTQHINSASYEHGHSKNHNYNDFQSNHQPQEPKFKVEAENTPGDRTENTGFVRGGSPGFSPNPGATSIGGGVGVNVGIKPPAVDVQVTKPVGPIAPIPNPFPHKPVPPIVEEPLVPIGILPKPILNLKGRMFFGAELGKGIGVKAGR